MFGIIYIVFVKCIVLNSFVEGCKNKAPPVFVAVATLCRL